MIFLVFFSLLFDYCRCQEFQFTQICPSSQYLSPTDLICSNCPSNTVPGSDGVSCVCRAGYIYTHQGGGGQVSCTACSGIVSADGWTCIPCSGSCPSPSSCTSNSILATKSVTGYFQNASCQVCAPMYLPSSDGSSCQLCTEFLNTGGVGNCSCLVSNQNADLACLTQNKDSYKPVNTIYAANGTITYTSSYLAKNLLTAVALCENQTTTGCEWLANMCVMQLYKYDDFISKSGGACGYYASKQISTTTQLNSFNWIRGYPWLYYPPGSLQAATSQTYQYSRGDTLDIQLAAYTINGAFLGMRNATSGGYLQMCSSSATKRAQTFKFGTQYQEQCSVLLSDLLSQSVYPPVFYDPYLRYQKAGSFYLQPIQLKIGQVLNGVNYPNLQFVPSNWIITRRLFMVDNVGAITDSFLTNATAKFVTYASQMRLVIQLQDNAAFSQSTDGMIQWPYLEVNLTTISSSSGLTSVPVSFQVLYISSNSFLSSFIYNVSVAMGVLSALAAVYAILRAYFWSRRSGCQRFEGIFIVKALAYACGAISNAFFLVIFGISLYFLILYKNQQLFSVIPVNDDTFFVAYLVSAFIMKLLEIIHMFIVQCSIDIFLIDWERPKFSKAPKQVITHSRFDQLEEPSGGDQNATATEKSKLSTEHNVSIWRTYFVANEWNEIQTYRKTSLMFNLMMVLLIMEVVGYGRTTTFDPFMVTNPSTDSYTAPYYRMFRFATIILIFSITGFIQWVFSITLYERTINDKLRNYVDLCSVANVSVFILENKQFGYYIHGRSVHGSADMSLAQMYVALKKESEGTCAKRGLESDSMQQTYIMALPDEFRRSFNLVYQPFSMKLTEGLRTEQYLEVNRFLDRFIHRTNNPRIPFIFKNRNFMEDVFNGEFEDHSLEGKFYRDNGTSFGNVLFYGNELTLMTFDMLLFNVIDLIIQNTVLDAIITWLVIGILRLIRDGCGSSNLAKKTMVDRRFLI